MKIELKARNIDGFFKIFSESDVKITDDSELINKAVNYLKKEFNKNKDKKSKKCIPIEFFKAVVLIMMKKIKGLDSEITLYDIGYEFGKFSRLNFEPASERGDVSLW
jgi:predicted hydrocarbon binding protein